MPTTITKTIAATSSPTTPDYTTLQAWEDAITADLVAADELWEGQCLDQGTFTSGITIGGQTTDATRFVRLTCGTGASFKDKAGVRTTALRYNSANGVTIETGGKAIQCTTANTEFVGLQVKRTAYSGDAGFDCSSSNVKILVDSCIIHGSLALRIHGSNSTSNVINTLCEVPSAHDGVGAMQANYYGMTIVNVGGDGTNGIGSAYSNALIKNCAIFGFSTAMNGADCRAGSGYNATDDSAVFGNSSNSLTNLTFADQFESSTNDFRAKSTGSLKAGTPDSTNTPDDITGLTRDATTPWIGCWEVAAAGGATPKNVFGKMLSGPFAGAI